MDEEKKSEASGEEPERVGPYLIQEQVQQSHDSQVELYLATHETSGATALVRKHTAEEDAAPRKDWRVRLVCWASRGYFAMEVEHTDWARAQTGSRRSRCCSRWRGCSRKCGAWPAPSPAPTSRAAGGAWSGAW